MQCNSFWIFPNISEVFLDTAKTQPYHLKTQTQMILARINLPSKFGQDEKNKWSYSLLWWWASLKGCKWLGQTSTMIRHEFGISKILVYATPLRFGGFKLEYLIETSVNASKFWRAALIKKNLKKHQYLNGSIVPVEKHQTRLKTSVEFSVFLLEWEGPSQKEATSQWVVICLSSYLSYASQQFRDNCGCPCWEQKVKKAKNCVWETATKPIFGLICWWLSLMC